MIIQQINETQICIYCNGIIDKEEQLVYISESQIPAHYTCQNLAVLTNMAMCTICGTEQRTNGIICKQCLGE